MSRTVRFATIRMNATPAPLNERLQRAEQLIARAVQDQAQVIVLPELFNAGYSYEDQNYALAEPSEGTTYSWMKAQALRHQIYLTGSLMLRDGNEVYNSALLFAPNGTVWRYDKRYPYAWERAFFREGAGITIADTPLGKFGMMICWDSAHPNLWQDYAGKVDAMLIPSCPPKFTQPRFRFPDGSEEQATLADVHFADKDIHTQGSWLGVPVVHSSGSGKFSSPMPLGGLNIALFSGVAPNLLKHWHHANQVTLEADYGPHSKIIDANGQTVGLVEEEEGYRVAELSLPDSTPAPRTPQPSMETPEIIRFVTDKISAPLMAGVYRWKKRP